MLSQGFELLYTQDIRKKFRVLIMEEKLETRALLQVVLDDTADTKSRSMVILLAMRISIGF